MTTTLWLTRIEKGFLGNEKKGAAAYIQRVREIEIEMKNDVRGGFAARCQWLW